ncbi:MAG TPA: carboxymuconolactone decarboxylase family protein [Beijerinckiaceae bacterium]|nr:carboxymuconolactone decarboxylase family protein [Beijerinckiaceae bacterium]
MSHPEHDACRLPPLTEASYSPAQKKAHQDFVATRKVGFSGPWHVLIRSPELLTHAQRMGEYLRYRCTIAGPLSELAVLLVAREWVQDFEFGVHKRHALEAGVAPQTIEDIRVGRRPTHLNEDGQIVADFVDETLRRKGVSDATWARAMERFGEQGCVDLCGLIGYYSLLAISMNAARVPPPPGEEKLPRFPA